MNLKLILVFAQTLARADLRRLKLLLLTHQFNAVLATCAILVQSLQLCLVIGIQMHLLLLIQDLAQVVGQLISFRARVVDVVVSGRVLRRLAIVAVLRMLASVYFRDTLCHGVLRRVRVLVSFHQISL